MAPHRTPEEGSEENASLGDFKDSPEQGWDY